MNKTIKITLCLFSLMIGISASAQTFQRWMQMARSGNPKAMVMVGNSYLYGDNGVAKDAAKAAYWYEKGAEKGLDGAQYSLGNLYFDGVGVKQDYKKAFDLYTKAAAQGLPDALVNLGLCYEGGFGVEQNYEKAFKNYQIASQKGNPDGTLDMALCYIRGLGVAKNEAKGYGMIKQLAENGHGNSLCYLGHCYETGTYYEKDIKKALELYDEASNEGSQEAYYNMAMIYVNGYDNGSLVADGKRMLGYLAEAGYQPAIEALKQLNK